MWQTSERNWYNLFEFTLLERYSKRWSKLINKLSSLFFSGGVCRQIGNDYQCDCMVGTSGKNCRTLAQNPRSVCTEANPCQNGATCKPVTGSGTLHFYLFIRSFFLSNANSKIDTSFVCQCTDEWIGEVCDTPLPLCMRKNPCFNGGICRNNVCKCPGSFTGEFCQRFCKVLNLELLFKNSLI